MSETEGTRQEIRRIRRMLRGMARLAKDATLTGSLQGGGRPAAQQYNQLVLRLEQIGLVPQGMFQPLAEAPEGSDASTDEKLFAEIGVAAALLASYLEPDEEEERSHEGRHAHGPHGNVIIGLGGMKHLEELKDLGRTIRENLPEWMRERERERHSEPREARDEDPAGEGRASSLSEVESRLAEAGARLQAVAEQLRRDSLTSEQRADLAEQLSRLGQEQARLAREHARLREGVA